MLHFFMAGADAVRFELEVADDGACRLAVHHAQGVFHETYNTSATAFVRMQELEDLLADVRAYDAIAASVAG